MVSPVSVCYPTLSSTGFINGNSDEKGGSREGNIIRQLPHIDWIKFDQHSDVILRKYAKLLLSVENEKEVSDPTVVKYSSNLKRMSKKKVDSSSSSSESGESTECNSLSSLTLTSSRSPALQIAALQLGWSGVRMLFHYIVYVASGETPQQRQCSAGSSNNITEKVVSLSTTVSSINALTFKEKLPLRILDEKIILDDSIRQHHHQQQQYKQQQYKQQQERNQQHIVDTTDDVRVTDFTIDDSHDGVNDMANATLPSVLFSIPDTTTTTTTTFTPGVSVSHTTGTEPDANKVDISAGIEEGMHNLQRFSTKTVLEQICSLAAHFDLEDEDLVQLMILPFEIAQQVLGDRLISFGDNFHSSKGASVSSVLRPLFRSMIVPILQGIRLILREKTPQSILVEDNNSNNNHHDHNGINIGSNNNNKNKTIKTAIEEHLPKRKSERGKASKRLHKNVPNNNGESGSNNNSSSNNNNNNNKSNGVTKENLIPWQTEFSSIDSPHFFSEVSPRCCESHLFQLLGEQNCSIMHFAISSKLWNRVNSLKEAAHLAMEKSSEVLCPLRTRFFSLRRQYIYLYSPLDNINPIAILPLSLPSTTVLDNTKVPFLETLKIPPSGETFHVELISEENTNITIDTVRTINNILIVDNHISHVNTEWDSSIMKKIKGEMRFGVYVLRLLVGGWVHHFIFQLDILRSVWAHRLDVAHTMGMFPKAPPSSSLLLLSSTTTTTRRTTSTTKQCKDTKLLPVCFPAFLRGRLALSFGLSAFTTVRVLGTGTFGRVLLVRHSFTGGLYALKVLRKTSFTSLRNVVEVRRERSILDGLNSPYITRIHATFQTASRVYFLLDYLPGGELLQHTCQSPNHRFDENVGRFFIAELAIAVDHLQQHGIVHRDIKGDNLVLDEDGHVILTDFGFAKHILDETGQPIRQHMCCGTLAYIAPEMLYDVKTRGYGFEVDWWSLGVVLFTLLTGFFPFLRPTHRETVQAIVSQPLQFPEEPLLSEEAKDILQRLIHKDPQRRIASLQALKQHAFFRGFDWKACEERQMPPPLRLAMNDDNDNDNDDEKGKSEGTTPAAGKVLVSSDSDSDDRSSYTAAFTEEEEQIKLAQRVYSKNTAPLVIEGENDLFGDFYIQQEMNGSARDDDSDFDYTIPMNWEADTQPHRRHGFTLIPVMATSRIAMPSVGGEIMDGLVGDFNESAYLSIDSMNLGRETTPSLPRMCSPTP
ncbi:RAC-beta serine/threonine protein kinase [Trypanosoma theileri]|uniref:RAC-beta serine/threonine protein kinase n=1 Tax=Trypanosoma theileri TaxID=67003 RepID=A0A1X0NWB6_9TRYP|nr:RAC-beta serine/threonine protein kinase [Trypanosoma theileri]ORC88995.1 RAC-beta serine/threonine protein kinase [Trypanosoma theileri]